MNLTQEMKRKLQGLTDENRHGLVSSLTNGTYKALDRRGLVEWQRDPKSPWGGQWVITEAGRAVLGGKGKT